MPKATQICVSLTRRSMSRRFWFTGKRCIKTLRQHNALPQQECMLDAKEGTRGSELPFSSSFTFHLYLLPVPFLHARSCCKNGITLLLPQDSAIPFLHSRIGSVWTVPLSYQSIFWLWSSPGGCFLKNRQSFFVYESSPLSVVYYDVNQQEPRFMRLTARWWYSIKRGKRRS